MEADTNPNTDGSSVRSRRDPNLRGGRARCMCLIEVADRSPDGERHRLVSDEIVIRTEGALASSVDRVC